jgi:hypothetical protein
MNPLTTLAGWQGCTAADRARESAGNNMALFALIVMSVITFFVIKKAIRSKSGVWAFLLVISILMTVVIPVAIIISHSNWCA